MNNYYLSPFNNYAIECLERIVNKNKNNADSGGTIWDRSCPITKMVSTLV